MAWEEFPHSLGQFCTEFKRQRVHVRSHLRRQCRAALLPPAESAIHLSRSHRAKHRGARWAEQIRRALMDWNRIEGNWKQIKGKVKEKWCKLTDDDLTVI